MQSFIQYRKYAEAVERQYERDRTNFNSRFLNLGDARERQAKRHLDPASARANLETPERVTKEESSLPAQDNDDVEQAGDRDEASSTSSVDENEDTSFSDNRQTLSRTTTQQSYGVNMSRIMTGIQVRRRTTKEGGGGHVFIVDFEGPHDPLNPHNWSYLVRWGATINVALIGWTVGFASSVDSGVVDQAAREFGVSKVVESLATGIFLIGFGFGALVAGPLSEEFGRNPIYILTLFLYSIFVMASALAPNIGAQLAFRFIAGWFGATPLACAGGSINDLWTSSEKVITFPLFVRVKRVTADLRTLLICSQANAAFMGPILGPVVGGFIGQSTHLSWQWCEWVTLIISGGVLACVVLFQPETYPPVLLRWRAEHLRRVTGDERFQAAHEIRKETFLSRIRRAVYRPFLLLIREPIVCLFGLYITIIYIILFTFLNGYTFIFGDTYGFSQGITGLCFVGILVGLCLASVLIIPIHRRYKNLLLEAENKGTGPPEPEERLWFAMLGAPAVPIAMFWMGWTTYPGISYWSPLMASVLFGYGILTIFISSYQYLIDTYTLFAASALASITVVRYVVSGGMVEVAIPMYKNLGVHWTCTTLGLISVLITPAPYLFYFYGRKIRSFSKFAKP